MKVIAKPVDVVVYFDLEGNPKPVRFRMVDEHGENKIIVIEKLLFREKHKVDKFSSMWIIKCRAIINDIIKDFELRYYCDTTKWVLYSI